MGEGGQHRTRTVSGGSAAFDRLNGEQIETIADAGDPYPLPDQLPCRSRRIEPPPAAPIAIEHKDRPVDEEHAGLRVAGAQRHLGGLGSWALLEAILTRFVRIIGISSP